MGAGGGDPPRRGPGRDGAGAPADAAGRPATLERKDQVAANHAGQRVPDKTDITFGAKECRTRRHGPADLARWFLEPPPSSLPPGNSPDKPGGGGSDSALFVSSIRPLFYWPLVTDSAPPGRASFSHTGRRRTRVFDSAGSALRTPCP